MSKSLTTILEIAAGVVLTLVIIGFIVSRVNSSKDSANAAADKAEKTIIDMLNSDKTSYDGTEVLGSEVLNAISKFKGEEFGIIVCTKKNTAGTHYGYNLTLSGATYSLGTESSAKIADAKKVTDNAYINPSASFLGEVLYDANEALIGIKFVQQ